MQGTTIRRDQPLRMESAEGRRLKPRLAIGKGSVLDVVRTRRNHVGAMQAGN